MKYFLLILSITALSGIVLAKPATERREKLLNTLLATLQEEDDQDQLKIIKQADKKEDEDEGDSDVLTQDGDENRRVRARLEEEEEGDGDVLMQEDEKINRVGEQDDEDEEGEGNKDAREQDGAESEEIDEGMVKRIQKLRKALQKVDKNVILAKIQALKKTAETDAESQFWHHFYTVVHHHFHIHIHHHHHYHGYE